MQYLSSQRWAPAPDLSIVLEALFVLQANDEKNVRCPDYTQGTSRKNPASSWNSTSRLLSEPHDLIASLKAMDRGSTSLRRCECLVEYTCHPQWPRPHCTVLPPPLLLHPSFLIPPTHPPLHTFLPPIPLPSTPP